MTTTPPQQQLADCQPYLKDGETPAQCIERERRGTDALLTLLAREKYKSIALAREVRYLRTYGNKDCTAMADAAMARGELDEAPT